MIQMPMERYELLIYIISGAIALFILKRYMAGPHFDTRKYDLSNKYAVITGGNSGIGKQTFLELVRLNCNVIIGARDKKKSQYAVKQALAILQEGKNQSNIIVEHLYLDLGSKKSVKQFADFVQSKFPKLDYLVNNAGVSLISKQSRTQDGFEMIYGINHLGHFYLTSLLMDIMRKSDFFRIINVSSIAHRRVLGFFNKTTLDWHNVNFQKEGSFNHNLAYSRSKLYNVLFTKSLSRKIPKSKGLTASLHPGVVRTQITRHQKFLQIIMKIFNPLIQIFFKNNKQGAQTTIFTVLDQSVQTGQYYADCKKSQVNELALSEQNADKLWDKSERDLGIKFDIKF